MPNSQSLPGYLKKYVVTQDYEKYTPLEHATWRCIMRQAQDYFADHAVPIYNEGLKKTGIPVDRIPRISEMNDKLAAFGWGAVGVEGFIPPSVFLDMLARRTLPIATDMRTAQHAFYTPAPDIVHEAAGHAPIIADPAYRHFLECYAQVAYRAIISSEDILLYEAIRYLSDLKENPDATPQQIKLAEAKLKQAYQQQSYLSEATKIARVGWWTIEYGLVGSVNNPKIYGAGLLSSVGEARSCLSTQVKKIPLSAACAETSYDITEPQPQLFIARSLADLPEVIEELQKDFAFKRGGAEGVSTAKKAKTIATLMLNSGISASGQVEEYLDEGGQVTFFKLSGPAQLCYAEKEIAGQGRKRHPEGFSSPLGRWAAFPETPPHLLNAGQRQQLGLNTNHQLNLKYTNGFEVSGTLIEQTVCEDKLVLLTLDPCTIKRGGRMFYDPSWGPCDLILGDEITSVFTGPGDRAAFGDYNVGNPSSTPGRKSPYSDEEKNIFTVFSDLRQLRESAGHLPAAEVEQRLLAMKDRILKLTHYQWLAALEVIECAIQKLGITPDDTPWLRELAEHGHDTVKNQEGLNAIYVGGIRLAKEQHQAAVLV